MVHSIYFEKLSQGNENDFHTLPYFIQLVKKQLFTMGKVLWGMTQFVLSKLIIHVCWAGDTDRGEDRPEHRELSDAAI